MSEPVIPLEEFDQEMQTTRALLERVPTDKGAWKPHEKSFPLGHLAQLIAGMPYWFVGTLRAGEHDLSKAGAYSLQPTEALLETFDRGVAEARKALEEVTGAQLNESWSLKMGEKVLMTMPRGPVTRQTLSHLVHHRGQLSVYLRMVDVKLPQIYGPTADEGWKG